jgi:hypothetical protein
MEYKPKRVGRPNVRKKKYRRGRPKKRKYPGPGSALRKTQYKVLNLTLLTHQMLKELSAYYKVSMRHFIHKIIEAAFNKVLIEVEQKHKEETEAYELYKAEARRRRLEREKNAIENQHQP